MSDYVPGGVGASYDWIGFDPRGVGASRPSLHCSRSYFGYNRPSYVPSKRAIQRYWLRKNRSYSDACANTAAKRALLPHLTTLDTVRDMDAIREALGVETISYYGFSYGTYLGEVYATRYPTRVGPVRARRRGEPRPRLVRRQPRPGPRLRRQHGRLLALPRRSPRRLPPREAAGVRSSAATTAPCVGSTASRPPADASDPTSWPTRCSTPATTSTTGTCSATSYSDLVRRGRGGALLARYRDSEMGDDNGFAVYNAVQCSDAPWPGWARTRRDASGGPPTGAVPDLGQHLVQRALPDLARPAATPKLGVSGSAVTAKMLLISETKDAATPYSGRGGGAPKVPLGLARRRHRRHHPRQLALGGGLRRQHGRGLPAHRDRADPGRRVARGPALPAPAARPPATACAAARPRQPGTVDPMPPMLRRDLVDGPAAGAEAARSVGAQPDACESASRRPSSAPSGSAVATSVTT